MRNYNLTYNNPYNRKIANKIIGLEMKKNQIGQPEKIKNNIPQAVKPLSGGAIKMKPKQKAQLNKMLKRGKGMIMKGGNTTSAPSVSSGVEQMDMVQPLRRPGQFIKPVKETKPKVLSYETNASNSPYYNQLELNKANVLSVGKKMPMTDKVNERRAKKPSVKDVKEGGFSFSGIGKAMKIPKSLKLSKEMVEKMKEKNGGAMSMPMPARKIGGKRVAGVGQYKGGFSFSGIGKAISSAVKKIPSLIRKGAPKLAKSALKFMKGAEGQKVIGNVLSEVGTQAVKKIFEAPPALQDEQVLGSGIKVDINRDDIVDGKMKDAFDKLVVNGELRKDRLPLVKKIMRKSGMGTGKKEMTGGIIPIILGIIGAVAAAAGATHSIVSAENERAKGDRVNQIRQSQEMAEQIAERYIQRKKEKGEEVDMKTDPVIKKLKSKKKDLELEAKKLGGSLSDVIDKMVDALMQGAELKTGSGRGKSMAKKGLEPKKEKKAGNLFSIIDTQKNIAKKILEAENKKKGGNLFSIIDTQKNIAKKILEAENKKKGGASKPKRQMTDKMKKRAELVKKIMKERGVKLAEASKIIKNEKLI